jgi:hypothetical protein
MLCSGVQLEKKLGSFLREPGLDPEEESDLDIELRLVVIGS